MYPDKTLRFTEILTMQEIKHAIRLHNQHGSGPCFLAATKDQIIEPAMPRITKETGVEHDPNYLACSLCKLLTKGYPL